MIIKKKQASQRNSEYFTRRRRLFLRKTALGLISLPILNQIFPEQAWATNSSPTLPENLAKLSLPRALSRETNAQKVELEALLNSTNFLGMAGETLPIPFPAFPKGVNFLIPGPEGLPPTKAMANFLTKFATFLPGKPPVYISAIGTNSGITLANRFTALIPANGENAAVLPGTALFARLAGDPVAQFNIDGLIAVAGGHRSVIGIGRTSFSPDKAKPSKAVRVAVSENTLFSDNDSLYVLLGFDIAGFPTIPVSGFRSISEKLAALAEEKIDLAVLSGKEFIQTRNQSLKKGLVPFFTQGRLTAEGTQIRDKNFQEIPTLEEYLISSLHHPPAEGLLQSAWQAIAATGSATFTLVLPPLTEPSMVALWRRAATEALSNTKLVQVTEKELMSLSGPIAAATSLRLANAPVSARLALHQWIAAQKFISLS